MKKRIIQAAIFLLVTGFIQVHAKDIKDADKVYKKLADKLSSVENKLPNKTIAIYGFEVIGRPDDSYARFATEKLTHQIVSLGNLMVIERSRIDQILKEQSLSMTGAIDSGTAAKIGKILSVDAVIIGTIHVTEKHIEFIARVIQSEKGIILASANEKLISEISIPSDSTGGDQGSTAIDNSTDVNIKPNKTIFSRSESVTITYSGLPGNQNDWITLVRASEPDSTYGHWFYTTGQKSGTYSFGTVDPGDYEIRIYFDWPNGGYIVRKRVKITVK